MQTQFSDINVRGIAGVLPQYSQNLDQLAERFGESEVKRIMASTGIQSIHQCAPTSKISDLCVAACQQLLDSLMVDKNTIDAIILVSQTPDQQMPATSVILQHKLGLKQDVLAFDINYGCSGYIYGLYQAALLIAAGNCQRVLLCAGDLITRHLNPAEQQVVMLFGDAVSATLVERGAGEISFVLKTDGSGADYIKLETASCSQKTPSENNENPFLYMDGSKVMEFALREVPQVIDDVLRLKNWRKEEVGTFALHQANQFMLRYLQRKLKVLPETVPIAVENIGNTGPASIPLMLVLQNQNLPKSRLEKTILCGFGVGLSWGAAALNLSATHLLPVNTI